VNRTHPTTQGTIRALGRLVTVIVAVACLTVPVLVSAPAQAASSAAFLKGTWVGPLHGYTSPEFCGGHGLCTGTEKITITKVKGHAAKGTWQYRSDAGGGWTDPQPLSFVVRAAADGTWEVYGSHVGGVYEGVYTPWTGVLELAYMSPNDVGGTIFMKLTKKT